VKQWIVVGMVAAVMGIGRAEPIADPGSRGVDWAKVKARAGEQDWAAKIVTGMKSSVATTQKRYAEPPLGESGWFHDYYCPKDARRLVFDWQKPTEHRCEGCGTIYRGIPYDDVWRGAVHDEIIAAIHSAAILHRITGEAAYLDYARGKLLWYANHYEQYPPHGKHAGKGKIGAQSLDEATQTVELAEAYWDLCPALSAEDRATIAEKLLIPAAKFIHAQTRTIHNIHSWHNAAVGLVGFAVGDKELVKAAIEGPAGLNAQIEKGIKDDGFWYEGSTGYHFYTIHSMEPLILAARAQGHPIADLERFLRMYEAPLAMAFDDGQFPGNNDGWSGSNLYSQPQYYEVAAAVEARPEFMGMLARAYKGRPRNSADALLYGPDAILAAGVVKPQSNLLKESGIAILRKDKVNAYLKFGPYGGGHDHNDRLNLILYRDGEVIVPDLGTSGYGIPLNTQWFRSAAAHNLLIVDGKKQANCGGELGGFAGDRISASVTKAFEGVAIRREIAMIDGGIGDQVGAESEAEHTYDLIYHVRGTVEACSVATKPAEALKGDGYPMLKNVQKGNAEKACEVSFKLRDATGLLVLRLESERPYEVFTGTCPDNPADKTMGFVMVRTVGKEAAWKNRIMVQAK
jgi:hypothetical protein